MDSPMPFWRFGPISEYLGCKINHLQKVAVSYKDWTSWLAQASSEEIQVNK